MKQKTTIPKVPISFRLSPDLKETLKEKAALNKVTTSDYLSQFIEENFSDKSNFETNSLSKLILQKKEEKKRYLDLCENWETIPFKKTPPPKPNPKPQLEYTTDNKLIVHIDPYSKNEYYRYLEHLHKKYNSSDSEIILAALIATTENRRSIKPKPFEYYLKGKTTTKKKPKIQSREEHYYSKITKLISGFILFLFVFSLFLNRSKS